MRGDQAQRPSKQRFAGLDLVPGGSAAGMRQADHVRFDAVVRHAPAHANDLRERASIAEHLLNRKRSHRQQQAGPQQRHLSLEESPTPIDLVRSGPPIATALCLPRKTSHHRRHVDDAAELRLIDAESRFEPAEQRLPRGPGERPSQLRLVRPRRLADQENATRERRSVHRRPNHAWTRAASVELKMNGAQLTMNVHRPYITQRVAVRAPLLYLTTR